MHTKTKNNIEFLQNYIRRHAGKWYNTYGDNLTGVHIGKKKKAEKTKNYYTITFNVISKKQIGDLSTNELIPRHFIITFPGGQKRKIKTDVIESGPFEFQADLLATVTDPASGEIGSLGLYLTDHQNNIYGLTNYHVAAMSLIYDRQLSYDINTHPPHHALLNNAECRLETGIMNPELDIAFLRIPSHINVNNRLPDGSWINNEQFTRGPITPYYRDRILTIYLPSKSYGMVETPITIDAAGINTRFMKFHGLVAVNRCSLLGDSGSIVLSENNKVFGMILGADQHSTFIIPYYKIHRFFPLIII